MYFTAMDPGFEFESESKAHRFLYEMHRNFKNSKAKLYIGEVEVLKRLRGAALPEWQWR